MLINVINFEQPKAKVRCVEAKNNLFPGLNNKHYKQFLRIFSLEDASIKREVLPIANMEGKFDTCNQWVVDSGATNHITHRIDWLNNDLKIHVSCTLPYVMVYPFQWKEVSHASYLTEVELKMFYTSHVYLSSIICQSFSKWFKVWCHVFPKFCVIHALNSRKLIRVGKWKKGLYHMSRVVSERKTTTIVSDLWQDRLGHASHWKLHILDFAKNDSFGTNGTCRDSCTRTKVTGLHFPVSSVKTQSCFELLHCDI